MGATLGMFARLGVGKMSMLGECAVPLGIANNERRESSRQGPVPRRILAIRCIILFVSIV